MTAAPDAAYLAVIRHAADLVVLFVALVLIQRKWGLP